MNLNAVAPPAPATMLSAPPGVYAPQHDSRLLAGIIQQSAVADGRRVLDMCTGSGFIAIAAAQSGASGVLAFDICPKAVRCARANVRAAGVDVDVRRGCWTRALCHRPFDVVVSNPPYVPTPRNADRAPDLGGPEWSWDGGIDGRRLLDPMCRSAVRLLKAGGSMLLVQSALAGAERSLATLRSTGLRADVVAVEWIDFGPVLSARARWLERTGRIRPGCRHEQLVVIRADKP